MKIRKLISIFLMGTMCLSLCSCSSCGNGKKNQNTEVKEGLYDGKLVINDNFEDESSQIWGIYNNGGICNLDYDGGSMNIFIDKTGNIDYGNQIFRDGFELNMNGVYHVSFDITCDIERPMQWRFQINGSDYHAYFEQEDMIGPETKTIEADFVMEEATDPAPRLCFNLGFYQGMDPLLSHNIKIDNFVLTLTDASDAQAVDPLPAPIVLKVNQVGYHPDDIKKVVATPGETVVQNFDVVDADGNVVYSGQFDQTPVESNSGDGNAYIGDFSDFKTPGTYSIAVSGFDNSYPFVIADDIYDQLAKDTVKMLYLQRCGCEVTEDIAGDFAHPECHTGKALIFGTENYIEVSGGWHDAGDYGRYVVAGAKTISDLLLSYDESEYFRGDDFGIPESGNGIPDLLDEAKYELDFFFKMQNKEGGVYHKVTCTVFPENVMPEEETEQLIVSPVSTTATADFAAVMAKASVVYRDFDEEYADKCLEASKLAFDYLLKHAGEDEGGFHNPGEVVTGEYPDANYKDEYFYAAVELYLATGENVYHDKAIELGTNLLKNGLGWSEVSTYAMYDYLKADASIQDKALKDYISEEFFDYADLTLSKSQDDPYFSALRTYPWGSNMSIANSGMLYRMAYNLTGDEKYNEYARYQIDYLLGVNPLGYCYVTGYGTLSPEHVHHRPSQAIGKPMPGMLVGGPNSNPSDPYAATVLLDFEGGMCYVDNDSAFSVNEITIYWNSPLIYLLSIYL